MSSDANREETYGEHGLVPHSSERNATLLQAALSYAARGWAIFPVSDGPVVEGVRRSTSLKEPCHPLERTDTKHSVLPNEWGRHVTRNPQRIATWWERWPRANVGIATGTPSGLLVLHIEGKSAAVQEILDQLPVTVRASAFLVYDYYFRMPQTAVPITNETGSLPVGVHVRGEKQYVLAPPSTEMGGPVSGVEYAWDHAPENTPLASLPAPICERIQGWPVVALSAAQLARVEEAEDKYLPDALERVDAGKPRTLVAKRLATRLRDAQLDMLSEAVPVMRAFAGQVKDIAGRGAFTEKDALAQLKRAYEGVSYKVWRSH